MQWLRSSVWNRCGRKTSSQVAARGIRNMTEVLFEACLRSSSAGRQQARIHLVFKQWACVLALSIPPEAKPHIHTNTYTNNATNTPSRNPGVSYCSQVGLLVVLGTKNRNCVYKTCTIASVFGVNKESEVTKHPSDTSITHQDHWSTIVPSGSHATEALDRNVLSHFLRVTDINYYVGRAEQSIF